MNEVGTTGNLDTLYILKSRISKTTNNQINECMNLLSDCKK